jgi:uncharacterized GH25 family protein
MRTSIFTFLFLMAGMANSYAHYIWLETSPSGTLNTKHEIKIRFGEYTYGVVEKVNGGAFKSVSDFSVWLVSPGGEKTSLEVTPADDHYLASFTPAKNGTYTIALDNKNMKVLDYTEYNMGILKPQYHCKTKVVVGDDLSPLKSTNPDGIEIVDLSNSPFTVGEEVKLQVLFEGKPLAKNEISIFIDDLWSKKLWTGEDGTVTFNLPWDTMYIAEATHDKKIPGSFNEKSYEYIWHCATYCIESAKGKN